MSDKVWYFTWKNFFIVAWFHKYVYISDETWLQLKPSPLFSCKFLMVHISPSRTGELNSHYQQSPMWVKGIHTMGCCLVPQRDNLRHCCHDLNAMQPLAQCSTDWLQWTRTLFAVLWRSPPVARTPRVGFWWDETVISTHESTWHQNP
jgi:hypothetical protein